MWKHCLAAALLPPTSSIVNRVLGVKILQLRRTVQERKPAERLSSLIFCGARKAKHCGSFRDSIGSRKANLVQLARLATAVCLRDPKIPQAVKLKHVRVRTGKGPRISAVWVVGTRWPLETAAP